MKEPLRGPQLLSKGNPHKHGLKDGDLESLRAILRKAIHDGTVPGVSLLLAHKGEVIFREAFGNLSVDQKVLMASSSKPITATVVMILVDQGKLARRSGREIPARVQRDHHQWQAPGEGTDGPPPALQHVRTPWRFSGRVDAQEVSKGGQARLRTMSRENR